MWIGMDDVDSMNHDSDTLGKDLAQEKSQIMNNT